MDPTRIKEQIKIKIFQFGGKFSSESTSFQGILSKSDVSRDLARMDYVLIAPHDADITDGEIINDSETDENYVPLMIEKPPMVGKRTLNKLYVRHCNASGQIKTMTRTSIASLDVWGAEQGTEETDWGWVAQKHKVWANFDRVALRPDTVDAGAIEQAVYHLTIPWTVNASYTPKAEDRFTTTGGDNWKIEDIDPYTYKGQAYLARVSTDKRD